VLSLPLLSRLHLSLSSISDPTHSPLLLLLLLLLSRCPPSPSSVFRSPNQFNGDLSAWDVGSVTNMHQSECTTVHPCVVFLMSPPSLSLFHYSDLTHSPLLLLLLLLSQCPLYHQCFIKQISSTETSRHGMSGVSPICMPVSVLLSIPAVLSLPHVSSPVSISLSLPFLIPHTHLSSSSSSSSSLDVLPLHHQCLWRRISSPKTSAPPPGRPEFMQT
jgi:surface protein